jgi:hypothetical protein
MRTALLVGLEHPEIDHLAVALGEIGETRGDRLIAGAAGALGVSAGTIRRWLRRGVPKARTGAGMIRKISELSGVPIELLIVQGSAEGRRRFIS